jgi:hypothetical protein
MYGLLCKACADKGLEYSAQVRIFNNMPYEHVTKAKAIRERQPDLLVREDVT